MADQQFGQPWGPQKPMIGTGEGEVPLTPPPAQKLDMRTMQSDIKSMQQTGGMAPQSYTPKPVAPVTPPPAPAERVVVPPAQPMRTATAMPTVQPPVPQPMMKKPLLQEEAPKSKKGLIIGIVVAVLVVGIAAVGYFFVYPLLFPAATPATDSATPPPQQEATTPPPAEETTPPPPATPETPAATNTGLTTHLTYFRTPADTTAELTLTTGAWGELKAGIASVTSDVPIFKEIVPKFTSGNYVAFSDFAGQISPAVFTSDVLNQFEKDMTFFTLTNAKGTWPGIIAKAKTGTDLLALKEKIVSLEGTPDVSSFFLSDPGTAGTWKDGRTGTFTNRYLTYSPSGASFDYGWSGNYLILSTSYDGFKEVLKRTE